MRLTGTQIKKEILGQVPGLKYRDISVTTNGSIDVTLKAFFPLSAIEKAARKHEKISYCEYSQEILSGGNTFVFVRYDYELKLKGELLEKLRGAVNSFMFSDDLHYLTRQKHVARELAERLNGFNEDDCEHLIDRAGYEELKNLGLR